MSAEAPKGFSDASPRVVQIPPQSGAASTMTDSQPPGTGTAVEESSKSPPVVTEDDHLNTDERDRAQWESRYSAKAKKHIRMDAVYVAVVMIATLTAILLTWRGSSFHLVAGDCTTCSQRTFNRYAYFYLGGQLGGTLFGVKYLYNVVARGWWNIDRRLWRLFSPFLSAGLALAVGALIDAGVFGLTLKATSGASYFSLGFVTGYFADSALRKMKEIADTIFGSPESHGSHLTKSK